MKTIYLVTSGSYSDYGVNAAFSTIELAQQYIDLSGIGSRIEECSFDPIDQECVKAGRIRYWIRMRRNGFAWVVMADTETNQELRLEKKSGILTNRSETLEYYELGGCIEARDRQHAKKIANEKRAMLIAEDKWPTVKGRDGEIRAFSLQDC